MGSGERRYKFSIRLKKDTIELIVTYGDDIPLEISNQSEGFHWMMDFYFNFISNNTLEPGTIVIIDDFGESLGYPTVRGVVKRLRTLAQSRGLTIVLSTNNILAIDSQHLDEVRLIIRTEEGDTRIINDFDRFDEGYSYDSIGQVLNGLAVGRNLGRTGNRRTAFVEGAVDYLYLNAFSEMLRKIDKDVDVDFLPITGLCGHGGAADIVQRIMSIERFPILLIDDASNQELIAEAESRGIKTVSIAEVVDGRTEVADLFSAKDAEMLGIEVGSFDNAACISHRLPTICDDLDEATKVNFARVIAFIASQ